MFPSPPSFTGSSCVTATTVVVTGSASGSLAPVTVTVRSLWFGGHRTRALAVRFAQEGGALTRTTWQSVTDPMPPPSLPVARTQISYRPGASADVAVAYATPAGPITGRSG